MTDRIQDKLLKKPAPGWKKAFVLALLFFAALFLILLILRAGTPKRESRDKKLKVVTTLFPYYDFLRQIAGDRIELLLVVPAGMDSHSFEPTPADMITIQNADLLVCNGGEMEQWLSKVVDSFGDGPAPGRIVTMMDYVDTVEEEIVEGMEAEEHDHSGDRHSSDRHSSEESPGLASDGDSEVEIEYDEHIWTSPVNAMHLTGVLTEALTEADPAGSSIYREAGAAYQKKLAELDHELRDIVSRTDRRLLVFGDKFPMRYFFDEYGLEYRAAFTGCSSDTEPSAQTIAYLIDKVREEEIPVVYYLELSSHRVAEIIGEETGAVPLLFHSCHNVTRAQFDAGVTYLDLMEQNAVNLRKGLK